jgi:hypothetical protein
MGSHAPAVAITAQHFLEDPHAARYRDVVENHPDAFAKVVAILNDPYQQEQLLAAERFGRPALAGVVGAIEADEIVTGSLASPASLRFRQAVGVAVRLTMEALGWSTTGKKGPIRGATYFRRAERYAPPGPASPGAPNVRARDALEAVERIGDEAERRQTAGDLLVALAESRRLENRPF